MSGDYGDVGTTGTASTGRNETNHSAVSVRGLEKTYGGGTTAFAGINLDIDPGTVVGILGPNGAGKTTLIKSMLDLVTPTAGERSVFGIDVNKQPTMAYDRVGAMFEGARNIYWRLTVEQNLKFFTRLDGAIPSDRTERFEILLEQLNLTAKRDTRVKNLSRGQKQKVALATILAGDKDLVFLDEPTLGLDVESSKQLCRELTRLVDRTDLTVVLSSHNMDVIEDLCDRAIILNDGEVLVDDSIENLLDVFDRGTYEVSLDKPVPQEVKAEIRRQFDVRSWSVKDTEVVCKVSLADANRLHQLTGVIIDAGCDIGQIDAVEGDFEDVFLALTDEEGTQVDDSASPGPVEGVKHE